MFCYLILSKKLLEIIDDIPKPIMDFEKEWDKPAPGKTNKRNPENTIDETDSDIIDWENREIQSR